MNANALTTTTTTTDGSMSPSKTVAVVPTTLSLSPGCAEHVDSNHQREVHVGTKRRLSFVELNAANALATMDVSVIEGEEPPAKRFNAGPRRVAQLDPEINMRLPDDVWGIIMNFLDIKDTWTFACLTKQHREIASILFSNLKWKEMLKEACWDYIVHGQLVEANTIYAIAERSLKDRDVEELNIRQQEAKDYVGDCLKSYKVTFWEFVHCVILGKPINDRYIGVVNHIDMLGRFKTLCTNRRFSESKNIDYNSLGCHARIFVKYYFINENRTVILDKAKQVVFAAINYAIRNANSDEFDGWLSFIINLFDEKITEEPSSWFMRCIELLRAKGVKEVAKEDVERLQQRIVRMLGTKMPMIFKNGDKRVVFKLYDIFKQKAISNLIKIEIEQVFVSDNIETEYLYDLIKEDIEELYSSKNDIKSCVRQGLYRLIACSITKDGLNAVSFLLNTINRKLSTAPVTVKSELIKIVKETYKRSEAKDIIVEGINLFLLKIQLDSAGETSIDSSFAKALKSILSA